MSTTAAKKASSKPAPALTPTLPEKAAQKFEVKAILREHQSWRGRIRAKLPFDGVAIRCIRVGRFSLMLGPWRGLVVAGLRQISRARVFERVSPTMFPELDIAAASEALDRNGFAVGLQLPPSSVKSITEFAAKAGTVQEAHWDCAEINRIARDTALVEVVRRYLGVEPILHGTALFWTLPSKLDKASYPEMFHYDVADFKAVCVCFYLTDVALDCGPHVAISATHKRKSIRRLINPFVSDQDASRRYGSRVTTFTGQAGMGFFEDSMVQHKRLAGTKARLALFINYTLCRKPDTVRGSADVKY